LATLAGHALTIGIFRTYRGSGSDRYDAEQTSMMLFDPDIPGASVEDQTGVIPHAYRSDRSFV
jgi:hypothetical protein